MINFLHSTFKPSVISNSISEDDYPASNLISKDERKRNLGFMAFTVTKPPIELEFQLNTTVELHRINIWPSIGALRSTGFEIFIKYEEHFIKLGHCSQNEDNIIAFERNSLNNGLNSNNLYFFSNNMTRKALNVVKTIKIVIKATKKCPPVLKKIEVWGYPSNELAKSEQDNIKKQWQEILQPYQPTNDSTPLLEREFISNPSNIPEEFLDAVTCELMVFPMTLPSGKLIDQSTIERHSLIEEKWGRPPSDPFTGKAFTHERKPILDAVLKSRIDKFLIENANRPDLKTVPRTLGNKIKIHNPKREYEPNSSKRLKIDQPTDLPKSSTTSLDDAVKNALKNITRFSLRTSTSSLVNQNVKQCFSCKSTDILYSIEICKHFICKNCLLTNLKKCSCNIIFKNSDVIRILS